ncbi:AraC family transcriptional regulator [Oceanobacter mangrovi]|uniref:AraC family transcriptional regulator n=1 Tax=Oceanobacter mangrovi TaxID=2862510 RepID=UPI001C8EC34B|nr:helix-turn-helix transcriptional regulator [Oceanobacter mangrovi]
MDIEIPPGLHWHQHTTLPDGSLLHPELRPEGGMGRMMGNRIDTDCPLLYLAEQLESGSVRSRHHHPRGQLAWAASGVLKVITETGSWIVPSSHAVWIACHVEHEILVVSPASIRYLFIDPSVADRLPDQCQVMAVTPLLREMIIRLTSRDLLKPDCKDRRLIDVVLDELGSLDTSPMHLPAGQDRRLQAVMALISRDPSDMRNLPELASEVGASPRTLERLFQNETGMSFRQWRSRLKLLEAVQRLGDGESSAAIALSLGYSSSSAFIAAFRKVFGQPPQSFAG